MSELQATLDSLDPLQAPAVEIMGGVKRTARAPRSRKLRITTSDMGRAESLRYNVLNLVNEEQYARASTRLQEFEASKTAFPAFARKAERYLTYSNDLINAIKAKRSFPNMHHLAVTKQQELYERAMEHVAELVATLRRIEQIDQECRAEDRRSTVIPVKALCYCVFAIMGLILFREISNGLLPAVGAVADDTATQVIERFFSMIGI